MINFPRTLFLHSLTVFNATFNNISVISWRSVLLVEKTTDLSQVADKLSHNVVHLTMIEILNSQHQ